MNFLSLRFCCLFARETSRSCIEFPGLNGDLQTGFEPIKFPKTRSVQVCHVIICGIDTMTVSSYGYNNLLCHCKMILSRNNKHIRLQDSSYMMESLSQHSGTVILGYNCFKCKYFQFHRFLWLRAISQNIAPLL